MSDDQKEQTAKRTEGGNRQDTAKVTEVLREAPPKLSVDDQQIVDIGKALGELRGDQAEKILPLARWSLDTVTHLTEYQDEKANRILTAVAFLSALVGVAFAVIVQRYPFSAAADVSGFKVHPHSALLLTLYAFFGLYFLLLTVGAAFTLFAVRPQFRIPSEWKHTKDFPRSFLFFQEILHVSGANWGGSFAHSGIEKLQLEYTKNSILETYLISQKIPKKLRPLKKGIWLFIASTLVLIVLLPLCAITVVYVDAGGQSAATAGMVSGQGGRSATESVPGKPQSEENKPVSVSTEDTKPAGEKQGRSGQGGDMRAPEKSQ